MEKRVLLPLLGAAALTIAYGPRTTAQGRASNATSATARQADGKVTTSLRVKVAPRDVRLALRVTNNTRKTVELRFPSGQTHDFAVTSSAGAELWRWSTGRMFTQTMQSRTVRPGGTVTFEESWDDAPPSGSYSAVATLVSDNVPRQERLDFTVR